MINKMFLCSIGVAIILGIYLFSNKELTYEEKNQFLKEKYGVDSALSLDFSNIEHLMVLRSIANENDKYVSKESLRLANDMILSSQSRYPFVEYQEAVYSYPTPEIILGIADGFLRSHQHLYLNKNYKLSDMVHHKNLRNGYEGAKHFYLLAILFAESIGSPVDENEVKEIKSISQCIDDILASKDEDNPVRKPCKDFTLFGTQPDRKVDH